MGQVGANLGNPNVVNPKQAQWGDLDASEKGARLIGGAAQGLNRGMQAYNAQGQQGGGPQMNPMQFALPGPQAPDFMQQAIGQPQRRGPNNLSFYGGGQ